MPNFLGLHISKTSLDAIRAESLQKIEVLGSVRLPETSSDQEWLEAVWTVIESPELGLVFPYEGLAISLTSGHEIYKKMSFPFSKDQIEKTIHFDFCDEVESVTKGDVEDLVVDHNILEEGQDETSVFAACSSKDLVGQLIARLEAVDADPTRIIPEISSVLSYLNLSIESQELDNTLVINTDWMSIDLLFLEDGKIADFRKLALSLGEIIHENTDLVASRKVASGDIEEPESENLMAMREYEFEEDAEEQFERIGNMGLKELNQLSRSLNDTQASDSYEKINAITEDESLPKVVESDSGNAVGDEPCEIEEDEEFVLISEGMASATDEGPSVEPNTEDSKADSLVVDHEAEEKKVKNIKRFLIQLKRTLFSIKDAPKQVVITGAFANDLDLIRAIESFGLPVYRPASIDLDLVHVGAMGALSGFFDNNVESLNLRKGELEYKGFFEKIAAPLNMGMLFLFVITCLLSGLLLDKKNKIEKQQSSIRTVMKQTLWDFFPTDKYKKKINRMSPRNVEKTMKKEVKNLEVEANISKYEKKYPITSCLEVWWNYQKVKNDGLRKKIVINKEGQITIRQHPDYVSLSSKGGRAVSLDMVTKIITEYKNSSYFDEASNTNVVLVPKDDVYKFDFTVKKSHE